MDISTIVYNKFRENFNILNSHYSTFKKNVFELSQNYDEEIKKRSNFNYYFNK